MKDLLRSKKVLEKALIEINKEIDNNKKDKSILNDLISSESLSEEITVKDYLKEMLKECLYVKCLMGNSDWTSDLHKILVKRNLIKNATLDEFGAIIKKDYDEEKENEWFHDNELNEIVNNEIINIL